MIFKGSKEIYAGYTDDGLIYLEQYSTEFGKTIRLFITLDQFKLLEKWVTRNECDIDNNWNGGVQP